MDETVIVITTLHHTTNNSTIREHSLSQMFSSRLALFIHLPLQREFSVLCLKSTFNGAAALTG